MDKEHIIFKVLKLLDETNLTDDFTYVLELELAVGNIWHQIHRCFRADFSNIPLLSPRGCFESLLEPVILYLRMEPPWSSYYFLQKVWLTTRVYSHLLIWLPLVNVTGSNEFIGQT